MNQAIDKSLFDIMMSGGAETLDSCIERLQTENDVSEPDAHRILFKAVADVNRAYLPPVDHLELIHTEGCNLGCKYCFEKDMLGHRRMKPDVATAAIDLLFEYSADVQELSIVHFGGEPIMNWSGVTLTTEYAEKRAQERGKTLKFNMTSNGTLIDREKANYLAQHNIMVLLSIDGLEASHDSNRLDKRGVGTFSRVLRALNLLKETQKWVGAKMTVMPQNASSIFEDVVGLYNLGVNQFVIGYATGVNWSRAQMIAYAQSLGKVYAWYKTQDRQDLRISDFDTFAESSFFGCQAGKNSIAVSVDGSVSACSKILALNNRELISPLGDVTYGLYQLKNRIEMVGCSTLKGNCGKLGIDGDYHGGCFASNFESSNNLYFPNLIDHEFSLLERSACSGCASHR